MRNLSKMDRFTYASNTDIEKLVEHTKDQNTEKATNIWIKI